MRRWASLLVAMLWLLSVPAAPPLPAQAAETPVCRQALPAATDGRLQLDQTAVRPGGRALGVLTGFRVWPAALVGGGSGETFLSCAPWQPLGRAEVMPQQAMALFVLTVPAGTTPGTYDVAVVFREGSRQPLAGDGRLVRLSTRLTVSAQPVPGTSVACALRHPVAPVGALAAPATAEPGETVRVTVTGVGRRLQWIEEYDRLWLLGCLANRATLGLGAPGPLDLVVPTWAGSGQYTVRVSGLLDGRAVTWQRSIQVTAATPSASPTPRATATAPASVAPSATPSATPSTAQPAPSPSVTQVPTQPTADEGRSPVPWLLGALAVTALVAGGWIATQRRR